MGISGWRGRLFRVPTPCHCSGAAYLSPVLGEAARLDGGDCSIHQPKARIMMRRINGHHRGKPLEARDVY